MDRKIVIYLLMALRSINLEQKILRLIIAAPICLGNISRDFSLDNIEKTGLNGYIYDFSVDYDAIANDKILDIHKYLMEKSNII